MLLDWDGLNDFHWENLEPDCGLEDEVVPVVVPAETHPVDEDDPVLAVSVDLALHRPRYAPYFQGNYDLIREAIKDHFTYQYNKGMKWIVAGLEWIVFLPELYFQSIQGQ